MFDVGLVGVTQNGDNIKADGEVNGVVSEICVGGVYEIAHLSPIHRFLRIAVKVVGSCLDFYEDDCVLVSRYYIYLFVATSPVCIEYGIAFETEVVCGYLLAFHSELVV